MRAMSSSDDHGADDNASLRAALASIQHASQQLSSSDAQLRHAGEQALLALRDAAANEHEHEHEHEHTLRLACYALQHHPLDGDPYVLFECLNLLLLALPSLHIGVDVDDERTAKGLDRTLDLLLHSAIHRSQTAATASPSSPLSTSAWPAYVRGRCYQSIAAVLKKSLALHINAALRAAPRDASRAHQSAAHVLSGPSNVLYALLAVQPTDAQEALAVQARSATALGIAAALVDELGLTARLEVVEASRCTAEQAAPSRRGRRSKKRPEDDARHSAEAGTAVGLTAEQHLWCKSAFQMHVLPQLANLALQSLYATLPSQPLHSSTLGDPAAILVARIVEWRFLLRDSISLSISRGSLADDVTHDDGAFEESATRAVPASFRNVLLTPDIVHLLAAAYRHALAKQDSSEQSIHRLRRCIIDAISLAPAESADQDETRVARHVALLTNLQALAREECSSNAASSTASRATATLFMTTAFESFFATLSVQSLGEACGITSADAGSLPALLDTLATLTSTVLHRAFSELVDEEEEIVYDQAIDALLRMWNTSLSLSADADHTLRTAFRGIIIHNVVPAYIDGRMLSARAAILSQREDERSEHGEERASDAEMYEAQLMSLAALARLDVGRACQHLLQHAQPVCQQLGGIASGEFEPTDAASWAQMDAAWEACHWLALIAGHVLADDHQGETASLPEAISETELGNEDIFTLLVQLGVSLPHDLLSAAPERQCSAQLIQTLLWFNARWTSAYLLTEAPGMLHHFSGQHGASTLAIMLRDMTKALDRFRSDASVVLQVASFLAALARSARLGEAALQTTEFHELILGVPSLLDSLPEDTQGELIHGMTTCIFAAARSNPTKAEELFEHFTFAVNSRFQSTLTSSTFASTAQRADVVITVQTLLDVLTGFSSSITPTSSTPIFNYVAPYFEPLVGLVEIYKDRPEVCTAVIAFFATLADLIDFDPVFGDPQISSTLTNIIFTLVQAISTFPRAVLPSFVHGEDDALEGLALALEMLTCLVENGEANSQLASHLDPASPIDVALFGFGTLAHAVLSHAGALEMPTIRHHLLDLSNSLLQRASGRIASLTMLASHVDTANMSSTASFAARLAACVGKTMELALVDDDADVALSTLEGASILARAIVDVSAPARDATQLQLLVELLAHLLQMLSTSLLIESMDRATFEANLLAFQSVVRACATEHLGGQITLVACVQRVQHEAPLYSRRSTARHVDEHARRTTFSDAIAKLVQLSLTSTPAPAPTVNQPPLSAFQARAAEAKQAKARDAAFVKAASGAATRARAALTFR
ncbi:Nuclear transport receptor exportin 4 (importin beta superfamily) [Ceraceosorus bombacis]|uniref:Nuclear transport receptor exportin 4 (Importin beta superfamily) n=1 Tax=Ceraceosorus bombacis TaxID=401625 RepID=A0A0P1BJS7_9BASI|nr:Nuclear transport receptor exportin 4 (importin beta superfamily) [Ceraceosorus bombacis]